MRGKVFTAEFILEGAYELAIKEGITAVTARGLSREMGISTQPIYMEFKNIDNLRSAVYQLILTRIAENYFAKNETLLDFMNNFYRFTKEEADQYLALTTDKISLKDTQKFFFAKFCEAFSNQTTLKPVQIQLLYAQIIGSINSLMTIVGQFKEHELIQELYERIAAVYSTDYFAKVTPSVEAHV
ncbi:hypothetical protein IGI37_002208 [Enterococcus sp. AZ194]|uniref:TetR/AcrR family transcriptional regulator n=1 Tax=Enterococcus sp. AZ194 TaxID=2774629 RepID=UPI003F222BB3